MADRRLKTNLTQEVRLGKVTLRKIAELGEKVRGDRWSGWESRSPEKGEPYLVLLEDDAVFRTSPVREIEKTDTGVVIRTDNSIYEVRYVRKGPFQEDPGK